VIFTNFPAIPSHLIPGTALYNEREDMPRLTKNKAIENSVPAKFIQKGKKDIKFGI
jgi:hypothetical protein